MKGQEALEARNNELIDEKDRLGGRIARLTKEIDEICKKNGWVFDEDFDPGDYRHMDEMEYLESLMAERWQLEKELAGVEDFHSMLASVM